MAAAPSVSASVTIRRARPEEVEPAARLCVVSFNSFNESVGLPPEFPGDVAPIAMLQHAHDDPDMELLVAVDSTSGTVVGTNTIDARDTVAAIGPIAVAPTSWSAGVGRRLMEKGLDVARAKGKQVTMLQQVASNAASFSLYARLGFVPTEASLNFVGLVDLASAAPEALWAKEAYVCRKLEPADAAACDSLFQRAMAPNSFFSRRREIEGALAQGGPTVYGLWASSSSSQSSAPSSPTLVAYTTGAVLGGHLVAATPEAFKVLLCSITQKLQDARAQAARAGADAADADLLPTELDFYLPHACGRRHPELLQWLLTRARLRLVRQLTGMAFGPPPSPCLQPSSDSCSQMVYCPSILY